MSPDSGVNIWSSSMLTSVSASVAFVSYYYVHGHYKL